MVYTEMPEGLKIAWLIGPFVRWTYRVLSCTASGCISKLHSKMYGCGFWRGAEQETSPGLCGAGTEDTWLRFMGMS